MMSFLFANSLIVILFFMNLILILPGFVLNEAISYHLPQKAITGMWMIIHLDCMMIYGQMDQSVCLSLIGNAFTTQIMPVIIFLINLRSDGTSVRFSLLIRFVAVFLPVVCSFYVLLPSFFIPLCDQ